MLTDNKSSQTFSIVEILFYLYFGLMLFAKGMGLQQGQRPYTLALVISAAFILAKVLLTKHSVIEWITVVLLIALGIAIFFSSGEIGAIILIATIVGMKDVPVKRVMVLGCIVWIFSFVFKMLLVLTGVQGDIFRVQEKLGLGHIIRWSLGQPHPNVLQISYMILCAFLLWLFNWKGRKLLYITALMFIGNLYIFMYSISYTGMILVTLYLMLHLFLQYKGKINRLEKVLFVILPIACMLFAILGPKYLRGDIWKLCDKVLNNRFTIAKTFMNWNPITLFGVGYCDRIGAPLNNLDCSYVYALMHYGIIFFVLFFGGYLCLTIYYVKTEKLKELAIISAMFVAAISEPFFVNTSFKNISVVFLGAAMFEGLNWISDRVQIICNCKKTESEKEIPKEYRQFQVDIGKFFDFCEKVNRIFSQKGRKVILVGVTIGIATACIWAFTKEMPHAYYMNRSNVQIIDGAYITLDINNLPDDFDGKILNYTDADTPMQRFDGNIVTVEYIRGIISMAIWSSLFSVAVMCLLFVFRLKPKE